MNVTRCSRVLAATELVSGTQCVELFMKMNFFTAHIRRSPGQDGEGVPQGTYPPSPFQGFAMRQAVCLLRSRRRTFLFPQKFQQIINSYVILGVVTDRRKVAILKAELKFIMIRKTTHSRGTVIYSTHSCMCFIWLGGGLLFFVSKFTFSFFTNRRRFEREKLGCLGVPEVWAMSPTMEKLEWVAQCHIYRSLHSVVFLRNPLAGYSCTFVCKIIKIWPIIINLDAMIVIEILSNEMCQIPNCFQFRPGITRSRIRIRG